MNANELRKPNLLQCQDGSITQAGNWHDGYIEEGHVKPIPLTEEWLLKLGFEFRKCGQDVNSGKCCHWDFWIKGVFYLRSNNDKYCFTWEDYVDVKYVHQLQNLYFALTGEELELKE